MPAGLLVAVAPALRVVTFVNLAHRLRVLAPLQKRRLRMHVGRVNEMGRWFCEQRHLDHRPTERPELARMTESLRKVGGTIAGVARTPTRAIAASTNSMRNHEDDDTGEENPAELTP